MRKIEKYLILLSSSLLLTFIIGFKFILFDGYIYLAEQFEVYKVQDFLNIFFPLWNDKLQTFNFAELPKIYLYFPITIISNIINSYKLLQILLLLLPYPIAFLSVYKLSNYINNLIFQNCSKKYIFISSSFAAFIYIINPWFAMNPRNLFFRIQFAFIPLLLYVFLKILQTRDKKYIIYLGIIMAIVASYRYIIIVSLIFIILFIIYIILLKDINLKKISRIIKRISVSYIIFGLISTAKFLPAILYSMFVPVQAAEQFVLNQIQRESLIHVFSTKIYEWTASGFDMCYNDMTHFLFIPVVAFSFIYLLDLDIKNKRKNFFFLFPPILYVAFVLIVSKEFNLDHLIIRLPLSDFIGRLLRHARWNIMPLIISVSIMLGISIMVLFLRIKNKTYPFLIIILILTSFSAWPLFTGDMNGYWTPTEPPLEYLEANNILDYQSSENHALWLPHDVRKASWSKQNGSKITSAPTGIFPVRSSSISSYNTWDNYFFDYYNVLNGGPGMSPLLPYKGNLSKIYAPINIKYIILHSDGTWTEGEEKKGFSNNYIKQVINEVEDLNWTKTLYKGNIITLFELINNAQEFDIKKPAIISGGLTSLASLSQLKNHQNYGFILNDISTFSNIQEISEFDHFIITDSDKFIFLNQNFNIISPKSFLKVYSPEDSWSPSSVNHPDFQALLLKNDIRWSWQYDYEQDLAFTEGIIKIPSNVNPKKEDIIKEWNFINNLSFYEWYEYNNVTINPRYVLNQSDEAMEIELKPIDGTEYILSPLISVTYGLPYLISLNIKGINTHKVNIKVLELDKNLFVVDSKHLSENLAEENFDWKKLNYTYIPKNDKTMYLQIQICQGHCNQIEPGDYPKKLLIKKISIWNVSHYTKNITMNLEFSVDTSDDYLLFIRYLMNNKGGNVKIIIDDKLLVLNTRDQISRFLWKNLGTFYLEKGNHKITLENINGFNSVNIFALISEKEYHKNQQENEKLLSNKTIIYLLEAENHFYIDKSHISSEFHEKTSNSEAVRLIQDEEIVKKIHIIQNGSYTIAINGKGSFDIQVNKTNINFDNLDLAYRYYGPIELKQGETR